MNGNPKFAIGKISQHLKEKYVGQTGEIERPDCPVCYEDLDEYLLLWPCLHVLCESCSKACPNHCPFCRGKISRKIDCRGINVYLFRHASDQMATSNPFLGELNNQWLALVHALASSSNGKMSVEKNEYLYCAKNSHLSLRLIITAEDSLDFDVDNQYADETAENVATQIHQNFRGLACALTDSDEYIFIRRFNKYTCYMLISKADEVSYSDKPETLPELQNLKSSNFDVYHFERMRRLFTKIKILVPK